MIIGNKNHIYITLLVNHRKIQKVALTTTNQYNIDCFDL